jgi:putative flippase GtrA
MTEPGVYGAPARTAGEIFRFGLVGSAATILYYVLTMLLGAVGVALTPASVAAYMISGAVGFVLHRGYTFAPAGSFAREASRFALLNLAGLLVATLAPSYLANRLGFSSGLAALVTCLVAPPVNFLVMRSFVFYRRGKASEKRIDGVGVAR